jgi:hypothetical protein
MVWLNRASCFAEDDLTLLRLVGHLLLGLEILEVLLVLNVSSHLLLRIKVWSQQ